MQLTRFDTLASIIVWVLILLCAVWAAPADTGSWTFTSTADQDAGLTWAVGRANTERAKVSPPQPPLNEQEYLQLIFGQTLDSYRAQKLQAEHEKRKEEYQTAPPAVKQVIDNWLKCGKATCP